MTMLASIKHVSRTGVMETARLLQRASGCGFESHRGPLETGNRMSLDAGIKHGKEHRNPYRGCIHFGCSYCSDGHTYTNRKRRQIADEQIQEFFQWPDEPDYPDDDWNDLEYELDWAWTMADASRLRPTRQPRDYR